MFKISSKLKKISNLITNQIQPLFRKIEKIEFHNENKVLEAFLNCNVSSSHFVETTGYGYDDTGRTTIDKLYSKIFQTQTSLVRSNFVSGTHAISVALFAVLKPHDTVLFITGKPYDTVQQLIGMNKLKNSKTNLKNYKINFKIVELLSSGNFDFKKIKQNLNSNVKLIYIQRSRGYVNRAYLSLNKINQIVKFIKQHNNKILIFVDNCYGEFVEQFEPTAFGVDLMCGSLIKNPGGGIATTGGYIVGNENLIEQCANTLTAPGLGVNIGCNFNQNINILKGLFLAPHIVANALKVAVFTRQIFSSLNFKVFPEKNNINDIISTITLKNEQMLIKFCEGIQNFSPIDSFVTPMPWKMPGYNHKIIMAAGTFTSGSTIEISADAPIKPPYNVFVQGGLTFNTGKLCVLNTIQKLIDENFIKI